MTSLLSWLECIVLRGVDMARTLSEEELMTLMLVPCHRTVIKSAVILTSLRPGIVSTSWCRHGDFVLELARMQTDGYGDLLSKVLLAWMS